MRQISRGLAGLLMAVAMAAQAAEFSMVFYPASSDEAALVKAAGRCAAGTKIVWDRAGDSPGVVVGGFVVVRGHFEPRYDGVYRVVGLISQRNDRLEPVTVATGICTTPIGRIAAL